MRRAGKLQVATRKTVEFSRESVLNFSNRALCQIGLSVSCWDWGGVLLLGSTLMTQCFVGSEFSTWVLKCRVSLVLMSVVDVPRCSSQQEK